jgi:hypothetical protein
MPALARPAATVSRNSPTANRNITTAASSAAPIAMAPGGRHRHESLDAKRGAEQPADERATGASPTNAAAPYALASDALDAGSGAARLFGARRPDSFRTKSTLCRYRMTGESQMDEARVAHVVGISFGLLWIAMLGLHMLSGT